MPVRRSPRLCHRAPPAIPAGRWLALALAAVLTAVVAVAGSGGRAAAQPQAPEEVIFLRIGTGPTGGTYFPVGGLIANAISNPPGSRPCDRGGSCGVPGLIAAAVSTSGSVANVEALEAGTLAMALVQADVGFWAWRADGIFAGREPVEDLRAIAALYPESIHLVARADSGIKSVADLKGKRVSLGEEKSGTLVEARLILNAHGLRLADLEPVYLRPGPSADKLAAEELDAFFFVGGAPIQAVADLAERTDLRLVPINGPAAAKLADVFPYLSRNVIPAGTYPRQNADVPTLAVGAVLMTTSAMTPDIAYQITRALWHPVSLDLYRSGHPTGSRMDPMTAAESTGVPLHPGARRFYDEARALAANEDEAPATGQ